MSRSSVLALAPVAGVALPSAQSAAHGSDGPHLFVSTLLFGDPNVSPQYSIRYLSAPAKDYGLQQFVDSIGKPIARPWN
jgi:hypothetical protein